MFHEKLYVRKSPWIVFQIFLPFGLNPPLLAYRRNCFLTRLSSLDTDLLHNLLSNIVAQSFFTNLSGWNNFLKRALLHLERCLEWGS